MAQWGSLNTTEKASCLMLEGWPSIKHSSQLFIQQPLSELGGGTGRLEWGEGKKASALHLNLETPSFETKASSDI